MFTHTFVSNTVSRASSREYLHPNDSNNVNGIRGSYNEGITCLIKGYSDGIIVKRKVSTVSNHRHPKNADEKLPSESGTHSDTASTGYSTGSVTSLTSISPVPSPHDTLTRPRRPRPRSAMADNTFSWGGKSPDGYHNGPIPMELITKAVKEFDSLRWCYEQNQRQYMEVVGKLQETQSELSKLKRASRFLVDDYETIQTQLEVQESCRIEAERYAAKMVQENKVLKRVSQGFLLEHGGKVPINENRHEPTEISELNSRISALTAIVGKLRSDLTVANDRAHCAEKEAREFKEKYEEERAEHNEAKVRVSSLEEVVKKFKRVSTMVVEEYEDLQQTLEEEKDFRIHAEEYAYKIRKERNALRHKSAILEGGVTMDDRLMAALDRGYSDGIIVKRKVSTVSNHRHPKNADEKLPSESGTHSDTASTGYSTGSVTSLTSISPVPSPHDTLTRPRRPRPRSAMADNTFSWGGKSPDGYHNGPIPMELITKAVKEFDSLRWCYEQNQRQYMEVVGKLQETQSELSKLKRASRFLVDDYETIQTQLEVQESCRIEAERYAAKVGVVIFVSRET
uniref:Uncharacterized protein n=1 Tax=Branchiostoma floridae TaxID=7739 RepID=C3Y3S1_BRAFL|eukprot:XP_002608937.1 hypothetical protein BRAFLDRAFT_85489 [Branchiostoma floridae]